MGISNPTPAASAAYDNTTSGLTADDVQAAIDEVVADDIIDAGGPVTITKIWSGSQAQYDGLGSYDADTLYFTPES